MEDNGTGMASEQLKKLFTVFYSTKGIKGTGMGLFIADTIVRQHGGDMVVESSLSQGSLASACPSMPLRARQPDHPREFIQLAEDLLGQTTHRISE